MKGWRVAAILWALAAVLAVPGLVLLFTTQSDFLGFLFVTLAVMLFTVALSHATSEKTATDSTPE